MTAKEDGQDIADTNMALSQPGASKGPEGGSYFEGQIDEEENSTELK